MHCYFIMKYNHKRILIHDIVYFFYKNKICKKVFVSHKVEFPVVSQWGIFDTEYTYLKRPTVFKYVKLYVYINNKNSQLMYSKPQAQTTVNLYGFLIFIRNVIIMYNMVVMDNAFISEVSTNKLRVKYICIFNCFPSIIGN